MRGAAESLRVLLVEDNPDDAELVLRALRRGGFDPSWERVQSEEELRAAVAGKAWDLILSDYVMPGFDGLRALRIVGELRIDVPFILVSGAIGDEAAVSAMKAGCADYVPKENLTRLAPAIRRELREAEVRRERRHARESLQFLAEVSEAFASSFDFDETVRMAARRAVPRLADWCVIDVIEDDGTVRRRGLAHVDPAKEPLLVEIAQRFPAGPKARSPSSRVLQTGEPVLLPQVAGEDFERFTTDAEHAGIMRRIGVDTSISVPMVARGRVMGALTLAAIGRSYGKADLATAEDFARRTALSLDNARLYKQAREAALEMEEALAGEQQARAAAETARRRAAFLAEASQVLASSLEYEVTLERVTRLAVPDFADWCGIVVPNDGLIRLVALAGPSPEEESWMRESAQRLPIDASADTGSARVIRTGEPWIVFDAQETPVEVFAGPAGEIAAWQKQAGLRSYLSVPVASRGRTFGALILARASEARRYGRADVELAQELGQRIAVAIDNALLYRGAQDAIRVRDDFLSVASHELNTPLTTLKIQVGTLARSNPDVRLATALAAIRRQIERMEQLVENLLDVSRLGQGRMAIEPAPMDLVELVREVTDRFGEQLQRASCTLRLAQHEPIRGDWDRARLDQVLTNLLANAIKFGAGQPIEVDVGERGCTAWFRVRDHGIGIEASDVQRIFDRFERAVPTRHYGGLGLGLFISRQIVESHGGTIRVESQPGDGAAFTVELPIAPTAGDGVWAR